MEYSSYKDDGLVPYLSPDQLEMLLLVLKQSRDAAHEFDSR